MSPGCHPAADPLHGGQRLAESLSFGIYALSLYDKYTGEGTRVRLNVDALDAYPHVRAWFLKEKPKREQEPELLREEIRAAGMDLLQAAPIRIHPDFW